MSKYIIGIMACDSRGVIGDDNRMVWDYPEETKHFRETTRKQIMIMGYNSFLSMPKEILHDRFSIVFSRQYHENQQDIIFVKSLEEFLSLKNLPKGKKYYMIGGEQIARLFLQHELIDEFILTKIKRNYEGNKFFPLELLNNWSYSKIKENKDFSIFRVRK